MREVRKIGFALCLGIAFFVLTGFGAKHYTTPHNGGIGEAIARRIALLRSGKTQQKAAAAYWLGQQRAAAADAVDPLVDPLGDATEVAPNQYRHRPLEMMTLG